MISGYKLGIWPLLFVCGSVLTAQQGPGTVARVVPSQSEQQISEMYGRIAANFGRLQPMFEQIRAAEWVAKGAPETYVSQVASVRQQAAAVQAEAASLARTSAGLDVTMRALFRAQNFHRTLDSLMGGLRRYQNPSLADLIQSVAAEDQDDLLRLQEYILELANQKEQEYQIVEREAQRCRAVLTKDPVPTPKPVRRIP